MKISILMAVVSLLILAVGVYVLVLLIRALRKYIRSEPVRKEKAASARSLGEVLKRRRTECKMTQEFAGRQPAGGLQVGERRIRSKHGEPHCACKALRHNAGGASERKSVTAEERPSIRLCRMVDALFSFMQQCSFLCAFRACKTG